MDNFAEVEVVVVDDDDDDDDNDELLFGSDEDGKET